MTKIFKSEEAQVEQVQVEAVVAEATALNSETPVVSKLDGIFGKIPVYAPLIAATLLLMAVAAMVLPMFKGAPPTQTEITATRDGWLWDSVSTVKVLTPQTVNKETQEIVETRARELLNSGSMTADEAVLQALQEQNIPALLLLRD